MSVLLRVCPTGNATTIKCEGPAFAVLAVPEGRHNGFDLCGPSGTWLTAITATHRSRSGLRSFVPDGTNQDDKDDSSLLQDILLEP